MVESPRDAVGNDAPGGASEARLAEFSAVSAQYAAFGNLFVGLALVPHGLCAVAAGAATWGGLVLAGQLLGALAPPLGLATAVAMRPWYQRHGGVSESGTRFGVSHPAGPEIAWWIGWLDLGGWFAIAALSLVPAVMWPIGDSARLLAALPMTGCLATIALFVWRPPRRSDGWWVGYLAPGFFAALVNFGHVVGAAHLDDRWIGGLLILAGLVCVVLGLRGHGHYLALDRRIRALRTPA